MDNIYFNDFAIAGLIERLRKRTVDLPVEEVAAVADALEERNKKVMEFSSHLQWVTRERDEAQTKIEKLRAENDQLRKELAALKAK